MDVLPHSALILIICASSVICNNWTYTNASTSQDKWGDVADKMCKGTRQSPIALSYDDAIYDPHLKPIGVYQNGTFAPDEFFTMVNNGHTLVVNIATCRYYLMLEGKENGHFCISQFHFHWGKENSVGSEHSIDGKFFPLEMHIVAFNRFLYQNSDDASRGVNGLAVISLVFQKDDDIPLQDTLLYSMGTFLQKVMEVQNAGEKTLLKPFPVEALLNISHANERYYRYEGSLTTPPCTENVYWTVISKPVLVNPQQLKAMRILHYSAEEKDAYMGNNYRKTQSINPDGALVQRQVFRSWNPASRAASSSLLLPSLFTFCVVLTFRIDLQH